MLSTNRRFRLAPRRSAGCAGRITPGKPPRGVRSTVARRPSRLPNTTPAPAGPKREQQPSVKIHAILAVLPRPPRPGPSGRPSAGPFAINTQDGPTGQGQPQAAITAGQGTAPPGHPAIFRLARDPLPAVAGTGGRAGRLNPGIWQTRPVSSPRLAWPRPHRSVAWCHCGSRGSPPGRSTPHRPCHRPSAPPHRPATLR